MVKKEQPPVEELKPQDPIEKATEKGEDTPDFASIKNRVKTEEEPVEGEGFDESKFGDVAPDINEPEKKEEEPEKEEPAKEETPSEEPETPKEPTPEPEPEPIPFPPPTPTEAELPTDLKEEEKTFDATLKNSEWRPTTWLELNEEQGRYAEYQEKVAEWEKGQETKAINERWDQTLSTLRTQNNQFGVTIPQVVDRNNQTDPGVKVEKELFKIAVEFGDEGQGTILPLHKAAKIWNERKTASKPTQPPGADAPISKGSSEAPKTTRKPYSDIKNKSLDDLIEMGLNNSE